MPLNKPTPGQREWAQTLNDALDYLNNQGTGNASDLTAHEADTNNPHAVTAAQVGAVPATTHLRGTGFPGSTTATNDAPVGTYYTDTAGTNGAWQWLKISTGSGVGRWMVTIGDTGWRNVAALLTYAAGLDVATTKRVLIRRTQGGVSYRAALSGGVNPYSGGAAQIVGASLTPPGMSPHFGSALILRSLLGDGGSGSMVATLRSGNLDVAPISSTISSFRWVSPVMPCTDPWPTTLPGIPG